MSLSPAAKCFNNPSHWHNGNSVLQTQINIYINYVSAADESEQKHDLKLRLFEIFLSLLSCSKTVFFKMSLFYFLYAARGVTFFHVVTVEAEHNNTLV